jgi:hypothetical protein
VARRSQENGGFPWGKIASGDVKIYGKSLFIVDFPIKNGGSFHSSTENGPVIDGLLGLPIKNGDFP